MSELDDVIQDIMETYTSVEIYHPTSKIFDYTIKFNKGKANIKFTNNNQMNRSSSTDADGLFVYTIVISPERCPRFTEWLRLLYV